MNIPKNKFNVLQTSTSRILTITPVDGTLGFYVKDDNYGTFKSKEFIVNALLSGAYVLQESEKDLPDEFTFQIKCLNSEALYYASKEGEDYRIKWDHDGGGSVYYLEDTIRDNLADGSWETVEQPEDEKECDKYVVYLYTYGEEEDSVTNQNVLLQDIVNICEGTEGRIQVDIGGLKGGFAVFYSEFNSELQVVGEEALVKVLEALRVIDGVLYPESIA